MKNDRKVTKIIRLAGVVAGLLVGWGMSGMPKVWAEDSPSVGMAEIGGEMADVKVPEIYIKAINPGYTIDGENNVGEMIEIARKDWKPDEPILLAGITISYTNSSGNTATLVEFPEHSYMTGETILLMLASSPGSELADVRYTKTLAFKGGISLLKGGEVIDAVCWTAKEGCYKDFKSASPTVLVRDVLAGEFVSKAVEEYEVGRGGGYEVESPPDEEGYGAVEARCRGVMFSELYSYYVENKEEQFIEFWNSGTEQVAMEGCMVRYKNKDYPLSGLVKAEEYLVYRPDGFSLTKNPTNGGKLELIDADGTVLDKLEYPNGQRKGTAWAMVGHNAAGEEIWRTTYAVTPGEANVYQEFKTCEEGKVMNEETGNCVKVTEVAEKVCAEGQYLNLLTGRCRKIEEPTETVCKEGYELNPETGRCKKIKVNDGAEYELENEKYEEKSTFVAIYAVIGVVIVGVGYVIWEYRKEIRRMVRAIKGKMRR